MADYLKKKKEEIISLSSSMERDQKMLEKLIAEFFRRKVEDFISLNLSEKEDIYWKTIKSFYFSQSEDSWKCRYVHETNNYISNNYCVNEESENEDLTPCFKKTKICFGYRKGKYFIQNSRDVVNVYTYKKLPRLCSREYENICEINIDEVMEVYSKNIDIPEWLMIRFFLQVCRHGYYPSKLKKYFGIISTY